MKTTLLFAERPVEPFLDAEASARIAKEINHKPPAFPPSAAPAKTARATRLSKLLDAFYFWSVSR